MILQEGNINEELKEYKMLRPAANTIHKLLMHGHSSDVLLDEAIVYYERIIDHQQETIEQYMKTFGPLPKK